MTEFVSNETQEQQASESIPFLKAGESKTMTISGVAREEGQVQSCVAVDYTPAVCENINVVKPDISLDCRMSSPEQTTAGMQGDDMAAFYACEPVEITCRVTNEGSGDTREAQLMFDKPDGLEFDEGEARRGVASISPSGEEEYSYRLAANQAGNTA